MDEKVKGDMYLESLHSFSQLFCRFKGRPLSVQQQMMQQSRQLDPNLLVKQQTPPSQQQSLHQPAMKSFLENVLPHTTPELQKGPSPVNAFSNFPIGGFLLGHTVSWCVEIPDLAGLSPREDNTGPLSVLFCRCSLSLCFREYASCCLFKKTTLFQKHHIHICMG